MQTHRPVRLDLSPSGHIGKHLPSKRERFMMIWISTLTCFNDYNWTGNISPKCELKLLNQNLLVQCRDI